MFSVCLKVFCSLFPSVCARCFVYGCTPDMHTHARTYTHTLAGLRSSLGTAPLPSSSQLILASCHVLSTSPLHPTHPPPPHFHLCFQTCFFFVCASVFFSIRTTVTHQASTFSGRHHGHASWSSCHFHVVAQKVCSSIKTSEVPPPPSLFNPHTRTQRPSSHPHVIIHLLIFLAVVHIDRHPNSTSVH